MSKIMPDKSLAAEIEAVILRYFPRSPLGDAAYGADRQTNCAAEIAALQSRAFENGARPHVTEALKREAQSQDFRRDLAERCYASLKVRLLKAAHKAFTGDDRALRRLVHAIENPNPLRGSEALAPISTEGRSDRA